jgi:hypothetical protein
MHTAGYSPTCYERTSYNAGEEQFENLVQLEAERKVCAILNADDDVRVYG